MKVFLDMDGVLVDFNEGTHKVFEKPYDPAIGPTQWHYYKEWKMTFEEFNARCGLDFFAGLRWFYDGRALLNLIESKFDDIRLLTTPMLNSGSWTGKMCWIERELPRYKKRVIMTQVSKAEFAGPDTLLIDDNDENIAEFVAAGGLGILVPRPWNELCGWANESLQVVKNSLEML